MNRVWEDDDGIRSEIRFAKLSSRNIKLSLTNLYGIIDKAYADRRMNYGT